MNHWSNYWNSTQALNSFAESTVGGGYTGEIKDYWDKVFSKQVADSKIVDIGCGNGALSCLAVEFSNTHNLNFDVKAIDAAAINPIGSLKDKSLISLLGKIQFHPNTPIEDISFPEQSIDLFISQFGFEYANTKKALTSVARALKPSGKLVLLSHHEDSSISVDTKAGVQVLEQTLNSTPLFIQVDLLLDIATQVYAAGQYQNWRQNPYNQSISTTIRWIMDSLKNQFKMPNEQVWVQDILQRVVSVLKHVGTEDPNQLRAYLADQFKLLNEHCLRLKDQVAATFDLEALDLLKDQAELLNLKTDISPFSVSGKSFAWSITIAK